MQNISGIGSVLKKITLVFMGIDIIGSILSAIYFLINVDIDSNFNAHTIAGDENLSLVALIVGAVSFCGLMFLYGFAQMVENTEEMNARIKMLYEKMNAVPSAEERVEEKIKDKKIKPEETLKLTNEKKMGECSLCNRKNVLVTKATYIADNEQLEFYVCNRCMQE